MKIATQTLSTDLTLNEVLEIEGALTLDPTKNITISTNKNIILTGKLISRPEDTVIHRIQFTGVNESKMVGGTEGVLDSDVGLWVVGAGQIDLQGIDLNWKDPGIDIEKEYDSLVALASKVTTNLRIEGTATGQSHMFIKSSMPQLIRGVTFRYMGPRKDRSGDGVKELVTGRYAVHFHHSEEGSRGSIVEGCVARDCNSHCFVAHGSHGITMRNNIVYNVLETPFWYDFGHRTHDLAWIDNLVVKVGYVARSQNIDSDDAPTFGAGGFVLGSGHGNKCNGNVVIGTSGSTQEAAAYIWPELRDNADKTKQLEDSWEFENNFAINCPMGLGAWQNNLLHHIVRNTIIINCPTAMEHGAYANNYRYVGGKIINGTIVVKAASATTNRVRFEGIDINAAGKDYCVVIDEGPLDGAAPVLFRACKMYGWSKKAVLNKNPGEGLKEVDIIDCGLKPADISVTATKAGENVRLQEGKRAWKITKSGISEIPIFAPTVWGTGTGLLAEYCTTDFKTVLLSRIEPNINIFDITHPQVHYKVPANYAVRFTGKIQPQYTEPYTFLCFSGGGVRMWIDNRLIIDKWAEKYPGEVKALFGSMIAGKLYDLKLEFFNSDDRSGCTLEWSSPSLKREFIPMSQLYPGEVKPPDPVPNKPPVADAGIDQTIEVSAMLYGTGIDPEGKPVTFKWEQVGGAPAVIVSPTAASTKVTGLSKGENVFKLTVTDEKGAVETDEVRVVVG